MRSQALVDETPAVSAATPNHREIEGPRSTLIRTAIRVVACLLIYVVLFLAGHVARDHGLLPFQTSASGGDVSGPVIPAARELTGYEDLRDFYVDYASAHAITHGKNAYDISANLFTGLGPAWGVLSPDPHPPTLMTLVLPFTVVGYGAALSAWALAMVAALIATLRLVGVRFAYAVGIGIGLAVTFPGAYGIGNPVPVIGLGVALAYRYRDNPVVAGLGIALAAAPKGSGVLIGLPFLLALRLRTVLWAIGFYALTAVVPMAWQHNIWSKYLHAGLNSVDGNANRPDNASVLRGLHAWLGISFTVAAIVVVLVAVAMALVQRDLFWPAVWGTVALLPIAWMYSLLTLVPLLAFVVLKAPKRTVLMVALAAAVAISSPPLGQWPSVTFPIALTLSGAAFVWMRPKQSVLWLAPPLERLLPRRLRLDSGDRTLSPEPVPVS